MNMVAVCSNRPCPSVQKTGRSNQHWTRDVYHLSAADGLKTLCGRDCREWLVIGPVEIDHHCCERCKAKAA